MARLALAFLCAALLAASAINFAAAAEEESYDADTPSYGTKMVNPPTHHRGESCNCTCPLPRTTQNDKNGCNTGIACTGAAGAYCNQANDQTTCDQCQCGVNGAGDYDFSYCDFGSASLCFRFCCEKAGTIHVQGQSLQACNSGCAAGGTCGATDNLYLSYGNEGSSLLTSTAIGTQQNKQIIDYVGACTPGQCFFVCEKTGVILTDTVKATITVHSPSGHCPHGCTKDH